MQSISEVRTVEWYNGRVRLIDQRLLPLKFKYVTLRSYGQVADAIKDMAVRGAPAIGVAAAMGLALSATANRNKSRNVLMANLEAAADVLRKSRPTARNLFWAIDKVLTVAQASSGDAQEIAEIVESEAKRMAEEDVHANRKIGEYGAELLHNNDCILTHCNTGTLATVSYGTALAPIRSAIKQGKRIHVMATETRPRLQGAKLTIFELLRDKIPVTLIVDGAVGFVMGKGLVQSAIVGADRITKKHVANKVGTYLIALAAQANHIPFYVAAPSSTFDLRHPVPDFEIEERDPKEVTHIGGSRIPPRGVSVYNPAFDLTPNELVSAFITEKGVFSYKHLDESLFSAR